MMRGLLAAFSGAATRGPTSSVGTARSCPSRLSDALPLRASSRSLGFYSTPPELRPAECEGDSGDLRFPSHQYNRVERIILVRHGESLGNVDETSYGRLADWRIPLTNRGKEQARAAGRTIRELMNSGPPDGAEEVNDDNAAGCGPECQRGVFFYVSPYLRTRQTLRCILEEVDLDCVTGLREEPRISEQQFGNYQCFESTQIAKAERGDFGRFYYRFPNGESGFDVYNRVSSFISTIFRDVQQLQAEGHDLDRLNICVVTHGLALRLVLMRWFQFTVHEFETSFNPENGSVIVLERHTNPENGLQWYEVTTEGREQLNLPAFQEQARFKVATDLSLLDRDWDEAEDVYTGPGNI